MRLIRLILAAGIMLSSAAAAGEIYRWRDGDGDWHYGRNPPESADAREATDERHSPQRPATREPSAPRTSSQPANADRRGGQRIIVNHRWGRPYERQRPRHRGPRRRHPETSVRLRGECGQRGAASVSRQSRSAQRRSSRGLSLSISRDGIEASGRFVERRQDTRRTTRVFAGSGGKTAHCR